MRETVHVRLVDITWSGVNKNVDLQPKLTHMDFKNDTGCTCKCQSDSSACNRFQYWDEIV